MFTFEISHNYNNNFDNDDSVQKNIKQRVSMFFKV